MLSFVKNKNAIKNIMFEGGGAKGLLDIGVIAAFEKAGIREHMVSASGSSTSSIMATLFAFGIIAKEISQLFVDIPNVPDYSLNALINGGLTEGAYFSRKVNEYLLLKIKNEVSEANVSPDLQEAFQNLQARVASPSYLLTFDDLALLRKINPKKYKELNITGANLTTQQADIFNAATSGSMPISRAIQISLSLPIMTRKQYHNNQTYSDGGIYANAYFLDLKRAHRDTMFLIFDSMVGDYRKSAYQDQKLRRRELSTNEKVMDYLFFQYSSGYLWNLDRLYHSTADENIVYLDVTKEYQEENETTKKNFELTTYDSHLNPENKFVKQLIDAGEEKTLEFLESDFKLIPDSASNENPLITFAKSLFSFERNYDFKLENFVDGKVFNKNPPLLKKVETLIELKKLIDQFFKIKNRENFIAVYHLFVTLSSEKKDLKNEIFKYFIRNSDGKSFKVDFLNEGKKSKNNKLRTFIDEINSVIDFETTRDKTPELLFKSRNKPYQSEGNKTLISKAEDKLNVSTSKYEIEQIAQNVSENYQPRYPWLDSAMSFFSRGGPTQTEEKLNKAITLTR